MQWTYVVAGPGNDGAAAAVFDNVGSVFVGGGFSQTVDFDPPSGEWVLTSAGNLYNAYVAKLNPDGVVQWVKGFLGYSSSIRSLHVGPGGQVLIAGHFAGEVDFDPGPGVDNHYFASAEAFLTALTTDGDYLWTRTFGGPGYDHLADVAVDQLGNILATGGFRWFADFDPGPGIDWHYAVGIYEEAFIVKLGSDGAYQWARALPVEPVERLTVMPDGSAVIGDKFFHAADFDPTDGVDWHTPVSQRENGFVTKLNPDGSYAWTKTFGDGNWSVSVNSTAAMPDGDILVTGFWDGQGDFDPGPGEARHRCRSGECQYLLRLTSGGDFVSARSIEHAGYSYTPLPLCVDQASSIYLQQSIIETTDIDITCGADFRDSFRSGTQTSYLTKLRCHRLGDFDADNDLDLVDVAAFQNCYTGYHRDKNRYPLPATCEAGCDVFDMNANTAIDYQDFALIKKNFEGPK